MHFARVAGENLVSPDEKATGIGTFVFVGFLEAYGIGVPLGGSGKLTDALIACIRDKGGEVLANVDVDNVIVKQGRAVGARATDGREFQAKDAVIGAIHPHHLRKMVPGVDDAIAKDAEATEISPVACLTVHAALNGPLKFKAGDHVKAVMIELLPNRYEQLRRSFDDMRYGEFSKYPLVGLGSLTMFDPSRVPAGKATMHAWDYVPFERLDGHTWDEKKREYAEKCSRTWSFSSTACATTSSSITATVRSIWSARRLRSVAVICTEWRRRLISPARIARRPTSGRCRCRGSSGCIWWGRSSIRVAACLARAARRPCVPSTTSGSAIREALRCRQQRAHDRDRHRPGRG